MKLKKKINRKVEAEIAISVQDLIASISNSNISGCETPKELEVHLHPGFSNKIEVKWIRNNVEIVLNLNEDWLRDWMINQSEDSPSTAFKGKVKVPRSISQDLLLTWKENV